MRKSYLESYYNIIPKTQQERLLDILKRYYDEIDESPDSADMQAQLEKIIAELSHPLGTPQIVYRPASKYGKISSQDYNNTMEETYVDLGALFKQDNLITKTIRKHSGLNEAVLRDTRAALRRVENDINVYKVVKENKTGITDAVYNTFYRDDNETHHTVYEAWVDTDAKSVKLARGEDHSALSVNGRSMAEIDLIHYGGGIRGVLESEKHRKERAIDEDPRTFWGEVILTDEPVRQTYDGEVYFGVLCEIYIKLFRAEAVNHIKYIPFTNYPLGVVKIKYKSEPHGGWVDLGIEPIHSTMSIEFNFDEIIAKEIIIVINQENPSINTYKLPRRIINNAELWQQIVDREYSVSMMTEEPIQATQDMIDYISGWQAYVDALESYKDRLEYASAKESDIAGELKSEAVFDAVTDEITKTRDRGAEELRFDLYGAKKEKEEELVEVRKYEYIYGAYNIDIKRIWYLDRGEYLSPHYVSNGPIAQAELSVDEVVPSGTTIEYQLSTREEGWRNIMPEATYIRKERLDIDPLTRKGILRFPAGYIDNLYRNDIEVPAVDFTYTPSTREVEIDSGWYVATAIYTVSYPPSGIDDVVPSGVVVIFDDDALLISRESIQGSDSRQHKVELNYYPFINYDIVNDTVKAGASSPKFYYSAGRWKNISPDTVYDIESGDFYDPIIVTVDGHSTENRTDYYHNMNPALTQYDIRLYPSFEYIQVGKNLYFNVDLKDREVKAWYQYLNDYIRFKALLRSNTRKNVAITPILRDYTIKLRTL